MAIQGWYNIVADVAGPFTEIPARNLYLLVIMITSRNGQKYTRSGSSSVSGMCKLLGTRKIGTSPLHPQSDGIVEHYNRTLEEYLRMTKTVCNLDINYSLFLLVYQSAVHRTTS